jgi:4,5-DOPA dioxygenase extradiol
MKRLPSLFVSHGAPTYAIEPGEAGRQLARLGQSIERPRAVLVMSPHWVTRGLAITAAAAPPTIHDFGGFPRELYRLRYAASGHPALAREAADRLEAAGHRVTLDAARGLDHGAWVPLMHLFPHADVPVVQLSMPADLDGPSAWRLGETLAPLAADGVLIVGSGSLTHNQYEPRDGDDAVEPYAVEFVEWMRAAAVSLDRERLVHAIERAPHGRRAHPAPDHYLPLPFAAGAAAPAGLVEVLPGGIRYGVLSMESYRFGQRARAAT